MAIPVHTNAEDLGRVFAETVSDRPSVTGLWVSTEWDGHHLWLLVREIGAVEERSLYGLLNILDQQFGSDDFLLHILNPSMYTIPLREALPRNAKKIFDRAA